MKAIATQYLEITEAKYVSGYKLLLTFNDGAVRVVDFGPFLEKARNPDTTDYRDLKKFKSFHVEDGDLMWGDYQMIFPIMDLYRGNILKGEETAPAHYKLNEGRSSKKSYTFKYPKLNLSKKTKANPSISYKKTLKYGPFVSPTLTPTKKMKIASSLLKHKKVLQHV
jgi:hypothetical protein